MNISTAFQNLHPDSQHGVGVSRPNLKARTRLYRVNVVLENNQKMIVTMPAESIKKAKLYAKNRWPNSQFSITLSQNPLV
tara:strand:+ start:627 stop:866 length:240 start_codon:yes stop_codon:yes gene_type:complete